VTQPRDGFWQFAISSNPTTGVASPRATATPMQCKLAPTFNQTKGFKMKKRKLGKSNSVEWDSSGRGSLGIGRRRWNRLRHYRSPAHPNANRLPACVRGQVVSCSASDCGLRNVGSSGVRRQFLHVGTDTIGCSRRNSRRRVTGREAGRSCWRRNSERTCESRDLPGSDGGK